MKRIVILAFCLIFVFGVIFSIDSTGNDESNFENVMVIPHSTSQIIIEDATNEIEIKIRSNFNVSAVITYEQNNSLFNLPDNYFLNINAFRINEIINSWELKINCAKNIFCLPINHGIGERSYRMNLNLQEIDNELLLRNINDLMIGTIKITLSSL